MRLRILSLLEDLIISFSPFHEIYSGIKIVHFDSEKSTFATTIKRSLDFLKNSDPRRFKRVTSSITVITSGACLGTLAEFVKTTRNRICRIDYTRLPATCDCPPDNPYCGYSLLYAALIVHEATHSFLEKHGILRTTENRERIESLCQKEELRVAARFPTEMKQELIDLLKGPRTHSWGQSRINLVKELIHSRSQRA